jgi:hypothetical protein
VAVVYTQKEKLEKNETKSATRPKSYWKIQHLSLSLPPHSPLGNLGERAREKRVHVSVATSVAKGVGCDHHRVVKPHDAARSWVREDMFKKNKTKKSSQLWRKKKKKKKKKTNKKKNSPSPSTVVSSLASSRSTPLISRRILRHSALIRSAAVRFRSR